MDELVLFSGGPDSTLLLVDLLKKKKSLRVLYLELGWCTDQHGKIPIQTEVAEKVLNYISKNYGTFKFSRATMMLDLNFPSNHPGYFGKDDQWCGFYGGLYARAFGLDSIWAGWFSYCDRLVYERYGYTQDYLYDDRMQFYIDSGAACAHRVELLTPKTVYNGTDIDRFETKKEAWDSLPWDLKCLTRSCWSGTYFCGKCAKCDHNIIHKIRDKYGNPL